MVKSEIEKDIDDYIKSHESIRIKPDFNCGLSGLKKWAEEEETKFIAERDKIKDGEWYWDGWRMVKKGDHV